MSALGVLRNHLASTAVTTIQRHLTNVFQKKRLNSLEGRARYIAQLFKSPVDHPIIWREYAKGDIKDHPKIGGYKTVRRSHSFLVLFPCLNIQHRRDAAYSNPTLSSKRSSATTPHPASWNHFHSKTQESVTDRSVSLPLWPPQYVMSCSVQHCHLDAHPGSG